MTILNELWEERGSNQNLIQVQRPNLNLKKKNKSWQWTIVQSKYFQPRGWTMSCPFAFNTPWLSKERPMSSSWSQACCIIFPNTMGCPWKIQTSILRSLKWHVRAWHPSMSMGILWRWRPIHSLFWKRLKIGTRNRHFLGKHEASILRKVFPNFESHSLEEEN